MRVKLFKYVSFLLLFCNITILFSQYNREDWAERDQWMKVGELLRLTGVEAGDQVADIGCHEGYFSFHLSRQVGTQGQVYAVDVQEYRLDELKSHLENKGVRNIKVILGEYDDPKLPSGKLDAAVIMDAYHEMEHYNKILAHIKVALKPEGRLLILEKLKAHKRGASRSEQVDAHTLSSKYVREELQEAGYTIVQEISDFGLWKNEIDKEMWILVATPKNP